MLFLAYAIIQIAIWSCCTIAAIHFNNIWVLFIAILGMVCMPEFKRDRNNKRDNNEPLDVSKK